MNNKVAEDWSKVGSVDICILKEGDVFFYASKGPSKKHVVLQEYTEKNSISGTICRSLSTKNIFIEPRKKAKIVFTREQFDVKIELS